MPVQWVNRPIRISGDLVARCRHHQTGDGMYPALSKTSRVDRIVTYDGDLDIAAMGQSIL